MYLTVDNLEGICKAAYDNYSALDDTQKKGTYWNIKDNNELIEFKSFVKSYYIDEQNFTCPYCKQRIVVDHNAVWDAEHIIPKDTHPQFLMEPSNLCVSCKDCNAAKGSKNVLLNAKRKTLPTKKEDYIINHPHYDNYFENIKVIELCGYYLPLNDKGRKTIEVCGLLRFTYAYANYGDLDLKTKELIVELSNKLMESTDTIEQTALLSFIKELASKGLAQMTADYIKRDE